MTGYPVIADPEDTELDQAYVVWEGDGDAMFIGRQRINMANQRFIGAVGFRQNRGSVPSVFALEGSTRAG
jgi:hypothetical protein